MGLFKAYCRCVQAAFRFVMPLVKIRTPEILDSVDGIADKAKELSINSVLIVTDDVLHNKLLLIDGLKGALGNKGIKFAVYDKTVPNPTIDNIEEGILLYKEISAQGIIAFGGGSPMDCAKGIAARIARPDKTIEKMRGTLKIVKETPTVFAVPTTSGTGSEATLAAVISNASTHEKFALQDPVLVPRYAVLDPALTLKLPQHITSTTGMDALTHAVEAYIGHSNTRLTRDMAEKATKLIFENLKRAYDDGSDIEARKNMQVASFYAGVAFTRAYVGNVHAIAHTLGGQYGVPHGLANAIILPYILDFYGEKSYRELSKLADIAGISGASVSEKAKNFIQAVKDMNSYMNIPAHIEKIEEKDISAMVDRCFKEANPIYPVPRIMSKAEFSEMYKKIRGVRS